MVIVQFIAITLDEILNLCAEGVLIEDVIIGSGRKCKSGDRVRVNYVGKLKSNNRVFDASKKPFTFKLGRGEVIRGWDVGCADMAIGGKRKLTIPPEKGWCFVVFICNID